MVHAREMADYGPTQEVVDGACEEEEEEEEIRKAPEVWGRLLPLAQGFAACGGLHNTRLAHCTATALRNCARSCEGRVYVWKRRGV